MANSASPRALTDFTRTITSWAGRCLRAFRADKAGAVVLLFGLTLIPIMGFVGGAIDYAYAYRTRAKIQSALDSAALAAGREKDMGASSAEARQVGSEVFSANLGENFPISVNVDFEFNGTAVTANASMSVNTFILGVVGKDSFDMSATSTVNISGGTVEVALVLDNSGSMRGNKLRDLKNAAKRLAQILYQNDRTNDGVKMAVVPFAASVNVGTQYEDAAWMDRTGESSIHFQNFDRNVTRWQMFSAMRGNQRWAGCVEARPDEHMTTDSEPTSGDSLFVPLFAPDEPDSDGFRGPFYYNSYLNDDDGSCGRPPRNESEEQAQEKTCKYDNERPSGAYGPNFFCDSQPIQELTDVQGRVISAIETMSAKGNTNIMEGVMWGWRVLSPTEPFTEGRPYTEAENRKFMIVMSDGANTYGGTRDQNMSLYSAFGYAKHGRLRSPTRDTGRLVEAMNEKTLEGCNNAKAADITIFTIAFDLDDDDTLEMLRECASGNSRAYTIDNGDALISLFEAIANEINRLRITS